MRRNKPPLVSRASAALLAILLAGAAANAADKPAQQLEKVEEQISREKSRQKELEEQSRKLALETALIRREMIEAARGAQEKEGLLTHLEAQLANLIEDAKQRGAALSVQRRQLAGTLGALARLSRNAPQAVMFSRGTPADIVNSALLLRIAVPRMGERVEELSTEVETLALVKRDIAGKLLSLRKTGDVLDSERARLHRLLDRKNALRRDTDAAYQENAEKMRALAAKASDMKELMARLQAPVEAPRPPRPASRPQPPAQQEAALPPETGGNSTEPPVGLRDFPENGSVTLPVAGQIVGRYGESLEFGDTARGVRLEARPLAQVVAPFDGKVVFAGPFRNYGQILIIEHRGGYHTLLAGLGRIDSIAGQWVLAGEPIGAMGTRNSGQPTLYLELRRNGQPINPLPWLAAGKQKVRG
ncbi:MAG: peptidoglycan DD-metalloendopeptidase family protein [Proteobacteria bacterium]|nr:peptidoglycan DD-metalloendopeptidase family protein [Pseudomonadota bacterium]